MTKITVDSFTVDENALQNQINSKNHSQIADDLRQFSKSIQKDEKGFDKDIMKIQDNWNNHLSKAQIQEFEKRENEAHQYIDNAIKQRKKADEQLVHDSIGDLEEKYINHTLFDATDSTHVYYGSSTPNVQGNPGDYAWVYNNGDMSSGSLYQYTTGNGWREIANKPKDIFGSDIVGSRIFGGIIQGAAFRSETENSTGSSSFYVDDKGDVYARNFWMDILSTGYPHGELNPRDYYGLRDQGQGLNFDNGRMHMTGTVSTYQRGMDYSSHNFLGSTAIAPDYIKLRHVDDPTGQTGRIDMFDDRIEISEFLSNQAEGTILTGSAISTDNLNVRGTLYVGQNKTLDEAMAGYVNNATSSFDSNINSIYGTLGRHQNTLDSHGATISTHSETLDSHQETLNSHGETLNTHQGTLDNHESRIDTTESDVSSLQSDNSNIWNKFNTMPGPDTDQGRFVGGLEMNTLGAVQGYINVVSDGAIHIGTGFNTILGQGGEVCAYRGSWGYMKASSFDTASSLSIKRDIDNVDSKSALSKILATNIKSWRYDNSDNRIDKNIGPIIDDVNNVKNQDYYTPREFIHRNNNGDKSVNLNNMISFLILSVQELQKQNSNLQYRMANIERKINNG